MKVTARLRNRGPIYGSTAVNVTSINFNSRTLNWKLLGNAILMSSFNDVSQWEISDNEGNRVILHC